NYRRLAGARFRGVAGPQRRQPRAAARPPRAVRTVPCGGGGMTPLYSTIVTPATDRNLVTLDDLREQLRVRPGDTANDAWYSKVIARSSLAAERYCNRIFAQQEYADTFRGGASGMA